MDKILVTRSSMPSLEEYVEEIRPIWESHWLTNMGVKHQQLQRELTSYLGVDHVALFTNGHMALELGIQAMELSGEVITTPFTFASTTHAIVRNGLTPVFCDINPDDYTIDVSRIRALITDKTTAIVPVHVYGHVCDVDAIESLAREYGLKVIYDAAHAFGERVGGRGVGDCGDASMFSFHATKVYNTIEGGAICYHDPDYGRELEGLRNFGIRNEEEVDLVGANAKMNEFQAAMGICNLRHVDQEIAKRKKAVETYRSLLAGIPGIRVSAPQAGVESNYAYFPVVVDETVYGKDRNQLADLLKQEDIFARKYFYPLTNSFSCYQHRFDVNDTPIARDIAARVLTLPLYADLKTEDVEKICSVIRGARI